MHSPAPLMVADAAIFGLAALLAGEGGPQVLYGFLALVGGLIGAVGLYAAVGKWAIRRLEALEAQTAERHAEHIATMTAMTQTIQEMQHHLFGVQGIGGMAEEMRRSQRFRHDTRQDLTIVFGVLHGFGTDIARLCERADLPYEAPPIDRRRRRSDDDG